MTHPLVIGSDHAGFALKDALVQALQAEGVTVVDVGCFNAERVDYPLISAQVVETMQTQQLPMGIICCGSGIGVSIAANRYPGIRAALVHDVLSARLSREHNDANVLCLAGRFTAAPLALEIVHTWLNTPFDGGRHSDRVSQLDSLPAC
jgi:ribose 5-phosphate isomerase B